MALVLAPLQALRLQELSSALLLGLPTVACALVGLVATGKLEFQSFADSILADISRIAVQQTITAPAAACWRTRWVI